MPEARDTALAQEYARHNSETAFAELVRRHINLVYAAALRRLGEAQEAEEVAQVVFIILAQKAGRLRKGTILSGWFYQTAQLTASNPHGRPGNGNGRHETPSDSPAGAPGADSGKKMSSFALERTLIIEWTTENHCRIRPNCIFTATSSPKYLSKG